MDLITPLELDVFYHSEDTATASNLDIPVDPLDLDTNKVTFYSIDNVQPIKIGNFNFTEISSGGDDFTCTSEYEDVKLRIEAHRKKTI